jgi:hypothetical protein
MSMTANTNTATKDIPKLFVCVSVVKNCCHGDYALITWWGLGGWKDQIVLLLALTDIPRWTEIGECSYAYVQWGVGIVEPSVIVLGRGCIIVRNVALLTLSLWYVWQTHWSFWARLQQRREALLSLTGRIFNANAVLQISLESRLAFIQTSQNADVLARASSNVTDRSYDSQSRETEKYGHESRGSLTQEWLCWRGPAEIYLNWIKVSQLLQLG